MKCLSLFSGIGGFDLALTRQGHEIIAACEIDKYARTVYTRHFPGVTIFEDATKLTGEEFGEIDIICAGFPCQTFSIAGKRLGFEESRGTLFFEIARLARQKRPRLLLLENVKGLLSHDRGKTFANILTTLDELGYDAEWQVLNSKYFVPQNRERIFIIGHLRRQGSRKIFPIGEINSKNDGMENKKQQKGKFIQSRSISTITATYWKGWGGSRPMMAIPVLCPNRIEKRQNGRRFKKDGEPMFTLTTQDSPGVYDGYNIRMLTPLECERLQGFPDNYTEGLSNTQRYKCLGNAVTVPVIEYILERMK